MTQVPQSQGELGYQEKNTSVQRGLASEKKPPKLDGASTIAEACDHPHAKRVELPLPSGLFNTVEVDGMVFYGKVCSRAPRPATDASPEPAAAAAGVTAAPKLAMALESAGVPKPVAAAPVPA